MAFIDPAVDTIVIRIVYDGPPLAGKTTSVRSLAGGLGSAARSPHELDGRTLYFDWLEYTGGLFEGRRIRCQIVSVPGQTMLASRRRYLLASADAVVFVTDSRLASQAAMVNYLRALRVVLDQTSGPPVGIVVQANQRDLSAAVPIAQMRQALDDADLRVGVIESIAPEGSGVRETFIFAVRLALDRVRECMQTGTLRSIRPPIDSAEELLADMRSVESGAIALATQSGLTLMSATLVAEGAPAAQGITEAASAEAFQPAAPHSSEPESDGHLPRLPDRQLPSGMIWPPVNGRLILDEAMQEPISLLRDTCGDWCARASAPYAIHSPSGAVFGSLDAGRSALIQWARLHASSATVLSAQRCVVLAQDGAGRFRLWQIVRNEPSMKDALESALVTDGTDPTTALLAACDGFFLAAERLGGAACALPLKLDTIGVDGRYLGRMPEGDAARAARRGQDTDILDALVAEFTSMQLTTARPQACLVSALRALSDPKGIGRVNALAQRFALEALTTLTHSTGCGPAQI